MIVTNPQTNKISNDLELLNHCLDGQTIFADFPEARYLKIDYDIVFDGTTWNPSHTFALRNGKVRFKPGEHIQPYVTLTEEQISLFLNNFKLDIAPAAVTITLIFLDVNYNGMGSFQLENLKFHAGKTKAVPAAGTALFRSINYNSALPLAFRFPTQNIVHTFDGTVETINKQTESADGHIFQILFFQQHGFGLNPGQFSDDFGDDFANGDPEMGKNALPEYKEGFIHNIVSSYTVGAVNFPYELNAWNVMWLDDNNIFNCLPFTGHLEETMELTNFTNPNASDFSTKKVGTIEKNTRSMNTGWLLKTERTLVKSLARSSRAWIFGDNIAEIRELYCKSEKLKSEDTAAQLYNYELEFEIDGE